MNLKTRIATIATASLFALSVATGAAAQSTADVTQVIGPNGGDDGSGALTASIADATFTPVRFSFTNQDNAGDLTLTVRDERGTFAGWNVTIQAGDFIGQGDVSDKSIPARAFTATTFNAPATQTNGATTDGLTTGTGGTTLANETMALSAPVGSGSGVYTQDIDTNLVIPGQTPAGTYVSTMTVNIASGPASMGGGDA